jgi:hypothetical protein
MRPVFHKPRPSFTAPGAAPRRPVFYPTEPKETISEEDEIIRDALRWRALLACERIVTFSRIPPRAYDAAHPTGIHDTKYLSVEFYSKSALATTYLHAPILIRFADELVDEFFYSED